MRAGSRFGIAALVAALALGPSPSVAQEATPPTTNTPAADAIGPRELRDFTINGTVTRPAPPPAERPRPAPAQERPGSPEPAASTSAPGGARPDAPRPSAPREQPAPSQTVTVALPPADDLAGGTSAPAADAPTTFATQPNLAPPVVPEEATIPVENDGSMLPWLLAALMLAAGIGYYAWRQHSRMALAGTGAALETFVPAEPAPEPLARAPVPHPQPSAPTGVISTRLRPWLELEFRAVRCMVDEQQASIEFEVSLFNSGSAPARDVLLEACMFNAGPTQDEEIGGFFARPVAKGGRAPVILPLKRLSLKSAVTLTREQMNIFEVAGRRLFVPLLAFNALYRWSGGEGQTSASYLVGRDGKGEKMAPFRLDLGPRVFRGLDAREHNLRVRK